LKDFRRKDLMRNLFPSLLVYFIRIGSIRRLEVIEVELVCEEFLLLPVLLPALLEGLAQAVLDVPVVHLRAAAVEQCSRNVIIHSNDNVSTLSK
jgi:hypothetical protein